ncbi:hypothetical protein [Vibrio ulleungensis]|uniref:ParB/Sulfiredoxin domain-containing protein n=1 Tax=Vibrio ulleungensis TaxID=2807619 RepID=A0ABS2HP96_9VIBR|nr:hypothetical protein [Vibrio ulleungensis]MBM7038541.1 hypothetical protein [Vibrio ulleungensis]
MKTIEYAPDTLNTFQSRGATIDELFGASDWIDYDLVELISKEGQQNPIRVAITQALGDNKPRLYLIDGHHRTLSASLDDIAVIGFEPEEMEWHEFIKQNALANYHKLAEAKTTNAQRKEMAYSYMSNLLLSDGYVKKAEFVELFRSATISADTLKRMWSRINKASQLDGFVFPRNYAQLLSEIRKFEGNETPQPDNMVLKQQDKLDAIGNILNECNEATLAALPEYLKQIDYIRARAVQKEMTRYRNRKDVQESARKTVRKSIETKAVEVGNLYRDTWHAAMLLQNIHKKPELKQELFDLLLTDDAVNKPEPEIEKVIQYVQVDEHGEVIL